VTDAIALADQAARDRIRTDLDTSLIVEAAAGAGKTTALVSRIVATIASGRTTLDRVVAVTFTEKAAGELKLRLRAEIEAARSTADSETAAHLTQALRQLEEARIGTIHGFCAELLRERPIEAGVDPLFEVAPQEVADELFDRAFERWFQTALASSGPGIRRILRRRTDYGSGPRELARSAARSLIEWRDFATPWRPFEFSRKAEIDSLVAEIENFGALAAYAPEDDWLRRAIDEIRQPVADALRLEAADGRDYDGLEAVLCGLVAGRDGRWRWRGAGEDFGGRPRAEVLAWRERLRDRLQAFRLNTGMNLASLLRDELWPIVAEYNDLKRRAGVLDFLDLLLLTRNLVRDNSLVRAELQERFTHIFIDEFQDTDPLQAEILLLLAAQNPAESDWTRARPAPGRLFIVGDPKQSIYRFRRADVSLYQLLKRRMTEQGAAVIHLTVSFRATPQIQKMVNAAFAPLMPNESASQPRYEPLETWRSDYPDQPSIVVLPVPAPYGERGRITDYRIEESLPDAIGAFSAWLVNESGWTVTERDAPTRRVPIRPRHICVLFRRFVSAGRDMTRAYLRALEARHLPHVLVRGASFNEREEVEAVRNALAAIERPDDELAVFAALRGPLFALGDDELLEFRETIGSLHPFRKIPEGATESLRPVGEALGVLRELHRERNRRPIAETISLLLAATRAHAAIAIWPTGEQALANVMRLMDMARRFEERPGATSFRAFVDLLEARAERDEPSEAPVVEDGAEGIRIMSVHRAKGLEFPVVILADITCKETAREAHRHVDPQRELAALRLAGCAPAELVEHSDEELEREREEAIRLLYVAATRARDLLVVPAVGDEPYEGWVKWLNPAIYPPQNMRRGPIETQPAGCPAFGDDSIAERSPAGAPRKEKSVAPGLHRGIVGDHRIVWWDPSRLKLNVQESMGLRQSRLLEAVGAEGTAALGLQRYRQWKDARERSLAAAGIPSLRAITATARAAASPAAAETDAIEIIQLERQPDRPRGKRFGTLVHATLTRVGADATMDEIVSAAALQARLFGATATEIDAAAASVATALQTPILQRAAAARQCRRESAISVMLEDGNLVEGVADLVFLDQAANGENIWTVVDYKTDIDPSAHLATYRAQVGLYVKAVALATGMPVRGVIMII
jgi:ATP-dependent helicase/nuclease subunit A